MTNFKTISYGSLLFLFIVSMLITQPVSADLDLNQQGKHTEPTTFYQVSSESDLPPVNPMGIKEDKFGNIHTWYYYLSSVSQFQTSQRVTVYYNIAFRNGTNFLQVISVEQTSTTQFALLQKQSLVETQNGGIYTIFIQSTDFGVNMIKVSWDPNTGFEQSVIDLPDVTIIGNIIGPVKSTNFTEFFVPVSDGTSRSIMQIKFDDGSLESTSLIAYPMVIIDQTPTQLAEVFDIVYANDTLYFLGSINRGSGFHSLNVVQRYENGTHTIYASRDNINVAPVLGGVTFYSVIREDILKPEMVATSNGQLYSFLFSLNEENQINDLVQWRNGTGINVFADAEEDPFLISFLPVISAIGDQVKIASLGVQIAQDVFTIAIDYFQYNVTSESLSRDKIQDASFSSGFFFFAIDFTSSDNLGVAGTISIPSYLKDQNKILNETVGAMVLFSNAGLPDVDPIFIDVVVEQDTDELGEMKDNTTLLLIIAISMVVLLVTLFIYWRVSVLNQVKIDEFHDLDAEYRQTNIFNKFSNFTTILGIHLRSNWRRYLVTTIALIIPILLLLSLFTGLLSHQDYLIQSYEAQNSLNEATGPNLPDSDFVWSRSIYDDELANNTLSPNQWGLAEQLTSTTLSRNGVNSTVSSISSTTVFPLFEKRLGHFINDQGENESINYPFPHDMAVIDPSWTEYFLDNLMRGSLPSAPNEILIHEGWFVKRDLFSPRYEHGTIYDVGDTLELYGSELDIFLNNSVAGLSQNLTIVGVVEKVENQPLAEVEAWADKLSTPVKGLRFLDEVPIYLSPLYAADMLNAFSRLSLRPKTHVNLEYDVFSLDRDDIPSIIDNYEGMVNRTFQETGIPWIGEFVDTRIIDFLEGYFSASNNIQLEATVIVIPVLGLILLLNYETLGIGRSSLEEEISRHKQEGMRTESILALFVFERLLTTGVATMIATMMVPILTPQLLSFTGFFQTTKANTPPQLLELLPVMAIGCFLALWTFGIILSLSYFIRLDDWRYQQYVSGVKGDIAIIVISGVLIGFSAFVSGIFEEQLNLSNPDEALNSNIELIFLTIRMISLLLGTFGAVLIFSKILNLLFITIGKLIWTIKKSRITLSFNGISSSMGVYGKLLVVFTIAFFLIVPMVVVPQSLQAQYEVDAYSELGSDIIATDWDTVPNRTKVDIAEIEGISSVSSYFFGTLQFANNLEIRTLAIDTSTFSETIVFPDQYHDKFEITPPAYKTLLRNQILTNHDFIERNPVDVGDTVELAFSHVDETVEFEIKDVFSQFPLLKHALQGVDTSESLPLQMVMSLNTLDSLLEIYETNVTEESSIVAEQISQRRVALKVDDLANVDEIAASIRDMTGIRLETISEYIIAQQHPFFRIFEFVSHLAIIVGIIAPMLSTLIFSNILFERRKFELEVYKRNGLSDLFFLRQMSIELILASLLPSLSGILIGSWWSAFYGTELFGHTSQDLIWVFNPKIIWGYTIAILLVSLLIWITQMYRQSRHHIQEVRL